MKRLLIAVALLAAGWAASSPAPPPVWATHAIPSDCALNPAPSTYEGPQSRNLYLLGAEVAGHNMIAPSDSFFGIPRVENGPRNNRTTTTPYVPPTLLKAVGWIESGLAQADHSVPWESTGPTKVSFDCGHGIMQVTSGMTDPADGGWPSAQQALVATHYLYNIGRGSAILAEKWNSAPDFRPIVGNGDPRTVEDWYFALWSYNGFTGPGANRSNHPMDPDYAPWPRTPFSCGPASDGLGHSYGNYPYQELVYGCAAHPPSASGQQRWTPLGATLPDLRDPRWSGPLSLANFVYPYRLMDMPTPQPAHQDPTAQPPQVAADVLRGQPWLAPTRTAVNGTSNTIAIYNAGSGILAWRAKPVQSWLRVNKQAGVTLSPSYLCTPGAACERASAFTISVNLATAPISGAGQVVLESLTTGQRVTVQVYRDYRADGALVKGSGPWIYLMRGGLKHLVPNPQTFEANRLDWAGVLTLHDLTLLAIPEGQPLLNVLADGNILRGSGTALYMMHGGAKRHITSTSVLSSCGYGIDAIQAISNFSLAGVPSGAPLTGPPCPAYAPPTGALIQGLGQGVYLINHGLRRYLPNAITFEARAFQWGDINRVAPSYQALIREGQPLLNVLASGNLLRGSSIAIYVTDNGLKRHVASVSVMTQCGYVASDVRAVSDYQLSLAPSWFALTGPPCPRLSPANGTLLQGAGPEVYVMDGGSKRFITSAPAFVACGYQWGNVNIVPAGALSKMPAGPPVTGAPCP